jgi:uncharacterized protein (TIGR02145 family)
VSGGNVTADGENAVTARGVCWGTTPNPTIIDSKTSNGAGIGTFISFLTGLNINSTYYVRAYAINSKGPGYGNELSFTTKDGSGVYDIDGNIYHTVDIGTQTWMVENLRTTKYNDGTNIPLIVDGAAWSAIYDNAFTNPAYCWYNNDISNKDIYGALYNWYTLNATTNGNKNVCPTGWHVPSDNEWTSMENYLIANGYNFDGTTSGNKIAKSLAATTNWIPYLFMPGCVGNPDYPDYRNITGFTALPAGYRVIYASFGAVGGADYFWSSTEFSDVIGAWMYEIIDNKVDLIRDSYPKAGGLSIRCLRDN